MRFAMAMALIVAAGFSLQLAAGRSTFAAPPIVHAHAIVFMGWVAIYLLQNVFATTGSLALHRRLGWIAVAWIFPMVILGCLVTVGMVQRGQAPFFFQPQHFLIFNPTSVVTFATLTVAAVLMRRRTDWHRRLHFCGMSLLLGPAFGRLLPMPLLKPWAFEATFLAVLILPSIAIALDSRKSGYLHPAWKWGMAAIVLSFLLTEGITFSALGDRIYASVTAGTPGAAVPGLAFAAPPAGPLITGRPTLP
ncbi:MAG: hypothetical protein EOO83_01230 [Oxalobacteraceae bacterium]|nr:MAG: hypothetical protein EOO83_01230 [Oxalobacteraceae bacterium]